MPKKSFWTSQSRYGTYEGEKGNPGQWSSSFGFTFENSNSVKSIMGMTAYSILDLKPSASDDAVRNAFRKLAKRYHPDKGGNRNKFEEITTAYETIKNMRGTSNHTRSSRAQNMHGPTVQSELIVPQLLTEIEESELATYLSDDNFACQEKKDGKHLTLQILDGQFIVRNKKGIASSCMPEFEPAIRSVGLDLLIDGEQIGTTFWAWDVLEYAGQDLRSESYYSRYLKLSGINFGPEIQVLKLVTGTDAKTRFYNELKNANKEGIVFKKLVGIFSPGKGLDQLKFKFYTECSVIVAAGRPGKASIGMELIGQNGREFVGYCSCNRHPPIGSVVEIKYLYAYPGGCLYQSSFKEPRDDVSVDECTISQLKYKPL